MAGSDFFLQNPMSKEIVGSCQVLGSRNSMHLVSFRCSISLSQGPRTSDLLRQPKNLGSCRLIKHHIIPSSGPSILQIQGLNLKHTQSPFGLCGHPLEVPCKFVPISISECQNLLELHRRAGQCFVLKFYKSGENIRRGANLKFCRETWKASGKRG
jgi:hypothetical protein